MNSRSAVLEQSKEKYLTGLIRELRPKQWTKNLLVFASAVFAGDFFHIDSMINACLAFIAFSLMASTIYVINDIVDIEKDRQHPEKCKRPIAAGVITVPSAIAVAAGTFLVSLVLAASVNYYLDLILFLYFVMNLVYSIRLKHVVIIDVMIIALGFVLRAIAGAVAVGGTATSWFILCTLGLSLFLALGKRRHELELFTENDSVKRRKVLEYYSVKLLDQLMAIVTAVLIMFYTMYAANQGQAMMFTIPLVLYGVFRYYYLVHMENSGGKPEEVLLNDRHILVTVVLFGICVLVIKAFF